MPGYVLTGSAASFLGLWPQANNTGVEAGVTLTTYTGPAVITTNGTLIENKIIDPTIEIQADNVTIRNCRVQNSDIHGIFGDTASNLTVEHCDLIGSGGPDVSTGILGSGTFTANDISGFAIGFSLTGPCTVQDNYVHDLARDDPTTHFDGIALFGGASDVLIEHNALYVPAGSTANVFLKNAFGPINNVTISNNLMRGGAAYTIAFDGNDAGGPITNVSVVNNTMEIGEFGYFSVDAGPGASNITGSGNIDYLTGAGVTFPDIGGATTLTAAAGSYAISGADTTFRTGAATGYVLTGQGATLRLGHTAGAGAYALTGSAAGLVVTGGVFHPDDIAGLNVWLDASQLGLADGAAVSPWPDMSGEGNDGIIVGSPAPVVRNGALAGLPVVRFKYLEGRVRGDTDLLLGGSGLPAPGYNFSVLYIGRMVSPNVGRIFAGRYPEVNFLVGFHTSGADIAYDAAFIGAVAGYPAGVPTPWKTYGYTASHNGTVYATNFYIDGSLIGGVTAGGGLQSGYNLSGYSATGTEETCDCEVAELLIYNHKLSDADRLAAENYLREKWFTDFTLFCDSGSYGIAGSAATFPGYDAPPPTPGGGYAGGGVRRIRKFEKRKRKRDEIEELIELIESLPRAAPAAPAGPDGPPPLPLIKLQAAGLSPPQRKIVKRAIVSDDEDDDDEAVALLLNLLS